MRFNLAMSFVHHLNYVGHLDHESVSDLTGQVVFGGLSSASDQRPTGAGSP